MRSHFWPVTDVQNGNLRAVTGKGAEELANRGLPECHGSVFDRTKASECLPQSARSEFIFASLSCVENEAMIGPAYPCYPWLVHFGAREAAIFSKHGYLRNGSHNDVN